MKRIKNNWHLILIGLTLIIVVTWAIRAGLLINSNEKFDSATKNGAINSLLGSIVAFLTLIVTVLAFKQSEQTVIQNIHFRNYDVLKEEVQTIESKILNLVKTYQGVKGTEEYKAQYGINDIITTVVNYWEEVKEKTYTAHIRESEANQVVTIFKMIRKCYEQLENKELNEEHRKELLEKADALILENLDFVFEQPNPFLMIHSQIQDSRKEDYAKEVSLELVDEYANVHRIYVERKTFKGEIKLSK